MVSAIVDYGMGNLHSVAKAIQHVSDDVVMITSDPSVVADAERVIFPGVGAIADCMQGLTSHGLIDALLKAIAEKPFLGICVGMQSLAEFSEENDGTAALDVLPAAVCSFKKYVDPSLRLKVPHMGWNTVRQASSHPLWSGIDDDERFYFVHSYYMSVDEAFVAGQTQYGVSFAAAVARDNLFAVQFHPEKSAGAGLRLLKNFMSWDGSV